MNEELPCEPCDPELYLGSLTHVRPDRYQMNLPQGHSAGFRYLGSRRYAGGRVGDMVVVDGTGHYAVARLTEVRLPERDRHVVESSKRPITEEAQPIGVLQPLATVTVSRSEVRAGVGMPPIIGSRVYLAPDELVAWVSERAVLGTNRSRSDNEPRIALGSLVDAPSRTASSSAQEMFGHHLAILGATGGGKSWTLAKVCEEVRRTRARMILLDDTGEHHRLDADVHVTIGGGDPLPSGVTTVDFPYSEMREANVFSLFTPSPQSQAPILREAIKSLKLAHAMQESGESADFFADGLILKASRPKRPFTEAQRRHSSHITSEIAPFDVRRLVDQLREDCVYVNAFDGDGTKFGTYDKAALGYVTYLVYRVESLLSDERFATVLDPSHRSVIETLDSFFADESSNSMRISLKGISYERNLREILADALVRRLLDRARAGAFADRPLVLCIDEAHNYLRDLPFLAEAGLRLDAVEAVAKEGRKYGLHLCLATQRPRDLTSQVASQIGAVIVHRLTDEHDLRAVRESLSGLDAEAAAYIPELAQGEAVVLGLSSIFPLRVRVARPNATPDSSGTAF